MKLTSKQRAFLKKEAHSLEAIVRVGKEGITGNVIQSMLDAIDSRELIKVKILQNVEAERKAVAYDLAEKSGCELVGIIGRIVIFFKRNEDKPVISDMLKRL